MFVLIRKEKNTFEKCGTQTTKNNIEEHRKNYSAGPLTCHACTNFSTNSRNQMNHHVAKKPSKETVGVVHTFKTFDKVFQSFYLLREQKRKDHGAQRGSGAQNVDVTQPMVDVDDNNLKEKPETCNSFWWTVR